MRNSYFLAQEVTLRADVSHLQGLAGELFRLETALGEQAKLPKTILTAVQRAKDRKSDTILLKLNICYSRATLTR